MITPLYYFKWMFQTYAYVMAGFSLISLLSDNLFMAIYFMFGFVIFGFISDDLIGMDIWRLENNEV